MLHSSLWPISAVVFKNFNTENLFFFKGFLFKILLCFCCKMYKWWKIYSICIVLTPALVIECVINPWTWLKCFFSVCTFDHLDPSSGATRCLLCCLLRPRSPSGFTVWYSSTAPLAEGHSSDHRGLRLSSCNTSYKSQGEQNEVLTIISQILLP